MHPLLADKRRLTLYLLGWLPVTGLLVLDAVAAGIPAGMATLILLPSTLFFAFVGLAAWYPCRALPIGAAPVASILVAHALGSVVAAGVWVAAMRTWAMILSHVPSLLDANISGGDVGPSLFVIGMLLWWAVAAMHYMLAAFEASHATRRHALELEVVSKDTELRALRWQLQPHFLFNGLNAISGLAGKDVDECRETIARLSAFLRRTLSHDADAVVPLEDELGLLDDYLAVERVRFGDRLDFRADVSESCLVKPVPPLILQPLIENAVRHGIENLVDGGTIALTVREVPEGMHVTVENPLEAARPRNAGSGVGLQNTRARLAALGREGTLRTEERDGRFRVEMTIPVTSRPETS